MRDLARIADFIGEHNAAAAFDVRRRLQANFALLAEHPQVGRRVDRGLRRFAVPRLPYLIFYRIDDEAGDVVVITIHHAARRSVT